MLLSIIFPKRKKLKAATIVSGIVPPKDDTHPFTLNSIPYESQLKDWKEKIVERKGQTCYAETPSGKFSLSSIQNMLQIHEIKNIKAAVDAISEDTAQKIPMANTTFLQFIKVRSHNQNSNLTRRKFLTTAMHPHMTKKTTTATPLQSNVPNPKFQDRNSFQSGLTKRKKFQCRHCSSCFTTNFSFRRHMQSRHPTATADLEGKSECNSCGFKCHRIGDLRTHLSQKHNVIFKTESITLNNTNGKSIIIINFIHTFSF